MKKRARSPHVVQLLSVPTCVTVLCGITAPPAWMLTAAPRAAAVAQPVPTRAGASRHRDIPHLLAVDERIAHRLNALRPSVKRRLELVMHRLSPRITLLVTSARRTRAEQAALHPTFGIKAKPGTSAHEDGRAIDVNVLVDGERVSPRLNSRIIGTAMASAGFVGLGRIDPVHYSLPKPDLTPADYTLDAAGPELDVMSVQEVREIRAEDAARDTLALAGTFGPYGVPGYHE